MQVVFACEVAAVSLEVLCVSNQGLSCMGVAQVGPRQFSKHPVHTYKMLSTRQCIAICFWSPLFRGEQAEYEASSLQLLQKPECCTTHL